VDFFEGALLGNSALGAIACTRPDAVMIHFGHNNVWDSRLNEDHKVFYDGRQLIWPRAEDTYGLKQAQNEAEWLTKWVKQMTISPA